MYINLTFTFSRFSATSSSSSPGFNAELIIFDTEFIILNTKFIISNANRYLGPHASIQGSVGFHE